MKKIIIVLFLITPLVIFAETQYRLKSDVYVDLLDEGGNKIRSGRIRSGTKIIIVQDDVKSETVKASNRKAKYIVPRMFKVTMPKMQLVKYSKCECEISTFFSGTFENCKKTHWNVHIRAYTEDGEDFESFEGYVSKTTKVGRRLETLLSDGKEHVLSLTVRYLDNETDNDVVEIVDFKK